MKKQINITIDATKGSERFWSDIKEAQKTIEKANKPSLWKRIKSWF